MIGLGVTHMLVGMGAVFVFLTLLVAATTLMSRLVIHAESGKTTEAGPEEIAAITAAIAQHRRKLKK